MTRRIHANNFVTTLAADASSGTTSLSITSATGFPSVGSGLVANVTLANGTDIEIVTCTAISGTTLTVTRGVEGTTPTAFVAGSTVSIRPTTDSVDRKQDEDSYTTTATAAGTTTLTVSSNRDQFFTGSTTQTVVLPVTSTLALGRKFNIINNSSGVVTVQSSGTNTIVAMAAATKLELTCILTSGTGTSSWDYAYTPNASGITGSGSLVRATSPSFTTPALGTPSSGVLSSCTGYAQSALTGLGTGVSTFLGTPSSSNLASAITDETGSGALVFATSPTLVTPTLGVASATSINFGQDALNYYDEGTFTPTFTSSVPGDLSVSYAVQEGSYTRIGNTVFIIYYIQFTPTFTTATGGIRLGGLPFTVSGNNPSLGVALISNDWTWPAGRSMVNVDPQSGTTYCNVIVVGSAVNPSTLEIDSALVSGVEAQIQFSGCYKV